MIPRMRFGCCFDVGTAVPGCSCFDSAAASLPDVETAGCPAAGACWSEKFSAAIAGVGASGNALCGWATEAMEANKKVDSKKTRKISTFTQELLRCSLWKAGNKNLSIRHGLP